jgi:hypothetical protein
MAIKQKQHTLREHVLDSIGSFLHKEGFTPDDVTQDGILEVINLISDYHEEGNSLYPEVILTNDLDFFKTIPNKELVINESDLTIDGFKKAIKLCAPLALDNWVIFIEVKNNKIKYGVVSAEMTETSLSIYNQTVGDLKIEYEKITIAYIRNIGQKTVELTGLKNNLIVSLTLDDVKNNSNSDILSIIAKITENCIITHKNIINTFLTKVILNALRIGHGNLIGVVNDTPEDIEKLMSENDGIYLPEPIDFQNLIIETETEKNNETSVNLKSYSSILKAMLNHDGITIFTNTGKLIGYHLLIKEHKKDGQVNNGGARSKAFLSMQNCNYFTACFYKSQDGNMKFWKL